jgi:outer membrane lipoprotein carrier protein
MRTLCWTLTVLLSSSISWANLPDKTAQQQLLQLLSPINSFSAHFDQLIIDDSGQKLQNISGVLHGQKPDKVFWTVFEPAAQTIVTNGSQMWLYDPDLEQVIIQPYNKNPQSNPISLLLGNPQQFFENFELLQQKNLADSVLQFSLKPVASNSLYSHLILDFKNAILSAITFEDNLGQTTILSFNKFRLNPLFNDDFFNFEIPLGVDIVNHVY